MKNRRRSIDTTRIGCGIALSLGLSACVTPTYDTDRGAGYVDGYFEPFGGDYGGWAPGYRVGPPLGDHSIPRHSRGN